MRSVRDLARLDRLVGLSRPDRLIQPARSPGRRGARGGPAMGAVASQALNAGGSLVVQVAVARVLGAGGFGSFVLLSSALILFTAIYTAFVGDSLTVLDRADPRIRGALLVAHLGLSTLAGVVGYALAVVLGVLGPDAAMLYGVLVFCWLTEELGRRIFTARLEFWRLTGNDAVYVGVTLTGLAALPLVGVRLTLPTVVTAMIGGALAAIIVAYRQIPASELRLAALQRGALREVAAFATWRALQAGIRPLVLLVARMLIGGFAGRATLGRIEAGRLLLAPAQTMVGAAGNVLLPMYVPERPARDGVGPDGGRMVGAGPGRTGRGVTVRRASALLLWGTLAIGVVAVVFAGPLSRFVVGPHIDVPRTAVFGWAAYTCALALGLPALTALVARRRSRTVFLVRLADAGIGLAVLLLVLGARAPSVAPMALAVSATGGAVWLQVLAGRMPASGLPDDQPSWWATVRARAASLRPAGGPVRRRLEAGNRWALAWIVLPLMLASDYKARLRDQQASVGGRPDVIVLLEIVVYATVAVLLVLTVARAPAGRRRPTLINLAWVFGAYFAAAGLWSPYRHLALIRGAQLLLTVAVAQAVARYARRDQLHGLAHAFVAVVWGSAVFGLLVPFPPVSPQSRGRFTWLYVHPVTSGLYLGAATVITLVYLIGSGRRHRVWPAPVYPVALAVVGAGLRAPRTRGARGAAVVGCVMVGVAGVGRARRADLLATVGVAVAIGVLTALPVVTRYFARGESAAQLTSINARTNLWHLAFEAFSEKPLVGWGLTASRGIFFAQTGLGGSHDAFVDVAVDGGSIGAAAFVVLIVALAQALRRLWRRVPPGQRADLTLLTALLAFLLINGLTVEDTAAPANVANILLFVLVGWAAALQRDRWRDAHAVGLSGPAAPAVSGPPAGTAAVVPDQRLALERR
ncbi:MAG: O-antigen ligase family protein [Frankia sp.]